MHYLYVAAPTAFQQSDCESYKAYLETHLAQHQPVIYSVQMVLRENLYGFQGNVKSPYLKITVTDPKHINKLRTSIESGGANYKGLWKGADGGVLTGDADSRLIQPDAYCLAVEGQRGLHECLTAKQNQSDPVALASFQKVAEQMLHQHQTADFIADLGLEQYSDTFASRWLRARASYPLLMLCL